MSVAPSLYLVEYLRPLAALLSRDDVTDIYINSPGEVWAETIGGAVERHVEGGIDEALLWRLARQVASLSHQGINRENPLLSAVLPDGSRVQIVAPPATRGAMAVAIRRHLVTDRRLIDYDWSTSGTPGAPLAALAEHDRAARLAAAVRARRTILISGGTSTGKTTFLNALLREIPADERLIVIEDTPELQLRHANAVGLVAVRNALGEARIDTEDLLQASLRMRPDRIILGELRGPEAMTFLRAINTGHPGSISTIHADTPDRAIEQLALLVLQTGTRLTRADIVAYVEQIVDVFVQLGRRDGRRVISEVRWSDRC
jgi:type IV secretion system protein VirB11